LKIPKIKYLIKDLKPLNNYLNKHNKNWTSVYLLVDSNTYKYCLPELLENIDLLQEAEIIEIEPGESNKTIEIATGLWQTLSETGADRSALLINVGGGVVTDLGGWVASTYKRGIDFIHLPTTLLGMVDAAIGGKTAIDLDGVKNMVGTFSLPRAVFAIPKFLDTLPEREWLSGFAELFKHALIANPQLWDYVEINGMAGLTLNPDMIKQASKIKEAVVKNDFKESGQRKTLNFGHTLGHAIESISLQIDETPVSHGHAIAIGMKLANLIAVNKQLLAKNISDRVNTFIDRYYIQPEWLSARKAELFELVQKDKKNKAGKIHMVLITDIGSPLIDIDISEEEIKTVL
jgi:3-dehydroquinate synthase